MTAGEAAARPDVRLRAAGAARCQDRAVVAVLRGWTRGHASKRAAILAALTAEGVDVTTIPELTALEQEEMRQKARPCPACVAKDAELAKVRADYQQALVVAAEFREECHHMEDERDAAQDEAAKHYARVVELEAGAQHLVAAPLTPENQGSGAGAEVPNGQASRGVTCRSDEKLQVVQERPTPRPAPRPREKCHVTLEMPDGTVTTPAAAAG